MVLISRNGMIGDIVNHVFDKISFQVLSQKSNLPTVNGHVSHDLDTRTLFGPDKVSLHVICTLLLLLLLLLLLSALFNIIFLVQYRILSAKYFNKFPFLSFWSILAINIE
ncbi:uncharacterized protein DC041_0005039 [Schistosoma bovis]|uniref:Uncharacterized protein n=1 Tax=Schistosoma bovis TaxID=6184 RepID=A0A430QJX4_SCHBO|nr:uncharacterized protein DC041_0005039 [Schistosoma bovis]